MKVFLAGLALAGMVSAPAWAEPPPASAFGRLPAVQQAAISPNGQTIALLGGTPAERIVTLTAVDQPKLRILKLGDVEATGLEWAGDAFLMLRVALWRQVDPTHSYRFHRNMVVTPDARAIGTLLEHDSATQEMTSQPILGVVPGATPRVIVRGGVMRDRAGMDLDTRMKRKGQGDVFLYALWNVDPATLRGSIVETGDPDTASWDVDKAGEPRVRLEEDELSHRFSLLARPKGSRRWVTVVDRADEEARRDYLGYSDPDDAIYQSVQTDRGLQLIRRRLADGSTEPLGRPVTGSDVNLVWDRLRGAAVGIAARGAPGEIEWLDPAIGAVDAMLAQAFRGRRVELVSWSADRTRFLARVSGPSAPGAWYFFDAAKKELSPIGEEYPELDGAPMGPTRSITYKARDGLQITAWLTLPPIPRSGRKPPLIVLPGGAPAAQLGDDFDWLTQSGGPAAAEDDGFDWLAQFLASRGYAVLRPRVRGAAGFGRAFERAGRGEWAGKMQTDLLDGMAAVAALGDADPSRACIVGWSFGGYAALAGAALHPEAYACAASIAGISDLGLLASELDTRYGGDSRASRALRRELAEPSAGTLRAASPLYQVAAIRAPVLLMHGDRDTVAPYEQSRAMAGALTAAGKPVEFVTFPDQGHDLLKSAPRTRLLETLEVFLARNLPVAP
jgi:dipeptidyl aminopeptidase/acylaminoacyl peptidase